MTFCMTICEYLLFTCKLYLTISVSAKGFYKSQDVIEFVSETQQLSFRQLEDPRCQIDRWKLEKDIRGKWGGFWILMIVLVPK